MMGKRSGVLTVLQKANHNDVVFGNYLCNGCNLVCEQPLKQIKHGNNKVSKKRTGSIKGKKSKARQWTSMNFMNSVGYLETFVVVPEPLCLSLAALELHYHGYLG